MENNLCSQPLLRFCEFGSCPWRNTSLLTTIAEERIVGGLHEILEQHSLTFSTRPVVVFFILSVWNDRIEERKKIQDSNLSWIATVVYTLENTV